MGLFEWLERSRRDNPLPVTTARGSGVP
jgi:hypothetical protein